jgi:predicted outer membrane repeat protein
MNTRSLYAAALLLAATCTVSAATVNVTIACSGQIDAAIDSALGMISPSGPSDLAITLSTGSGACNVFQPHAISGAVSVAFIGPSDGTALFMGAGLIVPRFQVTDGARFSLNGVTVGSAPRSVVSVTNATFTADNVTFSGNQSDQAGGAIVATGSAVTITRSVFDLNGGAVLDGAAIAMYGPGAGSLTVSDSRFSRNLFVNTIGRGGAIFSDGVAVTLNRVLFDSNKAPNNTGGAIYIDGGNLTVRNSTFTGNQAQWGGAIAIANPASSSTLLNNVTMRADSASLAGSELYISDTSGTIAASAIMITNSLISGTCAVPAGAVPTNPGSHKSIESPGNTCALPAGTNSVSVPDASLHLGILSDNGGYTRTLLPETFSVLIDNGGNDCESVDQRNFTRNVGACDVGALEVGAIDRIFAGGFESN